MEPRDEVVKWKTVAAAVYNGALECIGHGRTFACTDEIVQYLYTYKHKNLTPGSDTNFFYHPEKQIRGPVTLNMFFAGNSGSCILCWNITMTVTSGNFRAEATARRMAPRNIWKCLEHLAVMHTPYFVMLFVELAQRKRYVFHTTATARHSIASYVFAQLQNDNNRFDQGDTPERFLKLWWRLQDRRSSRTLTVSIPWYLELQTDDNNRWNVRNDSFVGRKPEPFYTFLKKQCLCHEISHTSACSGDADVTTRITTLRRGHVSTFSLRIMLPKRYIEDILHSAVEAYKDRQATCGAWSRAAQRMDCEHMACSKMLAPRLDCLVFEAVNKVNKETSVMMHLVTTLDCQWQTLESWMANSRVKSINTDQLTSLNNKVLLGVMGSLRDTCVANKRPPRHLYAKQNLATAFFVHWETGDVLSLLPFVSLSRMYISSNDEQDETLFRKACATLATYILYSHEMSGNISEKQEKLKKWWECEEPHPSPGSGESLNLRDRVLLDAWMFCRTGLVNAEKWATLRPNTAGCRNMREVDVSDVWLGEDSRPHKALECRLLDLGFKKPLNVSVIELLKECEASVFRNSEGFTITNLEVHQRLVNTLTVTATAATTTQHTVSTPADRNTSSTGGRCVSKCARNTGLTGNSCATDACLANVGISRSFQTLGNLEDIGVFLDNRETSQGVNTSRTQADETPHKDDSMHSGSDWIGALFHLYKNRFNDAEYLLRCIAESADNVNNRSGHCPPQLPQPQPLVSQPLNQVVKVADPQMLQLNRSGLQLPSLDWGQGGSVAGPGIGPVAIVGPVHTNGEATLGPPNTLLTRKRNWKTRGLSSKELMESDYQPFHAIVYEICDAIVRSSSSTILLSSPEEFGPIINPYAGLSRPIDKAWDIPHNICLVLPTVDCRKSTWHVGIEICVKGKIIPGEIVYPEYFDHNRKVSCSTLSYQSSKQTYRTVNLAKPPCDGFKHVELIANELPVMKRSDTIKLLMVRSDKPKCLGLVNTIQNVPGLLVHRVFYKDVKIIEDILDIHTCLQVHPFIPRTFAVHLMETPYKRSGVSIFVGEAVGDWNLSCLHEMQFADHEKVTLAYNVLQCLLRAQVLTLRILGFAMKWLQPARIWRWKTGFRVDFIGCLVDTMHMWNSVDSPQSGSGAILRTLDQLGLLSCLPRHVMLPLNEALVSDTEEALHNVYNLCQYTEQETSVHSNLLETMLGSDQYENITLDTRSFILEPYGPFNVQIHHQFFQWNRAIVVEPVLDTTHPALAQVIAPQRKVQRAKRKPNSGSFGHENRASGSVPKTPGMATRSLEQCVSEVDVERDIHTF